MRSIGKGAGRMFCGVMNLSQPPTRFFLYGKRILIAAKLVYEKSIQNAAKEAIFENEGGKCLSGKNRLTEHEIDNLQSYYGSAIRRNHSSVQNMRQSIWAIFLRKLSTDEYPQHGFCPIGKIHDVDLKG
ncbi:uncharacterized protein TNCV_4889901 [Trichonephila clavipes]|nr:uncharacterized protein TNCV_4889901 [Trichonephila clavipes]